jgi:hypothetical protein
VSQFVVVDIQDIVVGKQPGGELVDLEKAA